MPQDQRQQPPRQALQTGTLRVGVSPLMLGLEDGPDIIVEIPRNTPRDQIETAALGQLRERMSMLQGGTDAFGGPTFGGGGGFGTGAGTAAATGAAAGAGGAETAQTPAGRSTAPGGLFQPPDVASLDPSLTGPGVGLVQGPPEPPGLMGQIGELLPDVVAAITSLHPGVRAAVGTSRLMQSLVPGAAGGMTEAVRQVATGDMDADQLVETSVLTGLPSSFRVGAQTALTPITGESAASAAAKMAKGSDPNFGLYRGAILRGGQRVGKGIPTLSPTQARPLTTREGPLIQMEQRRRLAHMARNLRLGINPESFQRLERQALELEGQIFKALPNQASVQASQNPDQMLEIAKRTLPRDKQHLLQDYNDTVTLFSMLKQSELVPGSAISRIASGASAGGIIGWLLQGLGLSPAITTPAGAAVAVPFAFANMSPANALALANTTRTLSDVGLPRFEGAARIGVGAYGQERRRELQRRRTDDERTRR